MGYYIIHGAPNLQMPEFNLRLLYSQEKDRHRITRNNHVMWLLTYSCERMEYYKPSDPYTTTAPIKQTCMMNTESLFIYWYNIGIIHTRLCDIFCHGYHFKWKRKSLNIMSFHAISRVKQYDSRTLINQKVNTSYMKRSFYRLVFFNVWLWFSLRLSWIHTWFWNQDTTSLDM